MTHQQLHAIDIGTLLYQGGCELSATTVTTGISKSGIVIDAFD
jgi:hypothetical protein